MKRSEITKIVKRIISENTEYKESEIHIGHLLKKFNVDDSDLMLVIVCIEEELNTEESISDEKINKFKTVKDIVDYFESVVL